jgi:mRNA interferase MazF
MVIQRGDVWWAELPKPIGSHPAGRRPVLVIQTNALNNSNLNTVVIVVLTSNVKLGQVPSNVYLEAKTTGLEKDSVVNVSQLFTINKSFLEDLICNLSDSLMHKVDKGLKFVMGIS